MTEPSDVDVIEWGFATNALSLIGTREFFVDAMVYPQLATAVSHLRRLYAEAHRTDPVEALAEALWGTGNPEAESIIREHLAPLGEAYPAWRKWHPDCPGCAACAALTKVLAAWFPDTN